MNTECLMSCKVPSIAALSKETEYDITLTLYVESYKSYDTLLTMISSPRILYLNKSGSLKLYTYGSSNKSKPIVIFRCLWLLPVPVVFRKYNYAVACSRSERLQKLFNSNYSNSSLGSKTSVIVFVYGSPEIYDFREKQSLN